MRIAHQVVDRRSCSSVGAAPLVFVLSLTSFLSSWILRRQSSVAFVHAVKSSLGSTKGDARQTQSYM